MAGVTQKDIRAFLEHYAPQRVPEVASLVATSLGLEDLWDDLLEEYGPWPPAAIGRSGSAALGETSRFADTRKSRAGLDNSILFSHEKALGHEATDDDDLYDLPLQATWGRAVLIGVDYKGLDVARGSVAATIHLRDVLLEAGFAGDIRTLVDDGGITNYPTKQNILQHVEWLATATRPGQCLLLTYSGRTSHGGADEENGSGSLLPADYKKAGGVRGADLLQLASRRMCKGSQLFFICSARPLGHELVRLEHRVVSHPEGDVQQRATAKSSLIDPGTWISVLSAHRPGARASVEVDYDLVSAFCRALQASRKPAHDHDSLLAARASFLAAFEQRFEGASQSFADTTGRVLVEWSHLGLVDLQQRLAAVGVDARMGGIVQNLLRRCFSDVRLVPLAESEPPPLLSIVHAIRDDMLSDPASAGVVAPQVDTNADPERVLGASFVARPQNWTTFGVFPDSRAVTKRTELRSRRKAWNSPAQSAKDLPWLPQTGYVSAGGDILHSPLVITLQNALVLAQATPECLAFCFKSDTTDPQGNVSVFFKDKYDLSFPTGSTAWVTYSPYNQQTVSAGQSVRWQPPDPHTDANPVVSHMAALLWHARPPSQTTTPAPNVAIVEEITHESSRDGGSAAGEDHIGAHPESILHQLGLSPFVRLRLFNFYQHYNPSKVPSVMNTIKAFKGKEDELFSALNETYGPDLPYPEDALPPGWHLAESTEGDLFYKHDNGLKQWIRPVPSAAIPPTGVGASTSKEAML